MYAIFCRGECEAIQDIVVEKHVSCEDDSRKECG